MQKPLLTYFYLKKFNKKACIVFLLVFNIIYIGQPEKQAGGNYDAKNNKLFTIKY